MPRTKTRTASTGGRGKYRAAPSRQHVCVRETKTEYVPRPLKAKDFTKSKTIWLSIAGFLTAASGLLMHITNTGYFSDPNNTAMAMGLALALLSAAQFINRFYTDRPIEV